VIELGRRPQRTIGPPLLTDSTDAANPAVPFVSSWVLFYPEDCLLELTSRASFRLTQ
jgi:hypothetical protein